METVVKLDPDVEELLRNEVRNKNVDFDRALNDAIRAGLVRGKNGQHFVQKTYKLGPERVDIMHALALADDLEDEETLRKMKLAERLTESR